MTLWVDVAARARGLRTHRLAPGALAGLARAPDLATLGRQLRLAGFPVDEGERRAEALEQAARRRAAAELALLARWCGPRAAVLAVIFEDEDRRSLRALLRGALQHAPAAARLAGLVPTPTLPERALAELAAVRDPAAARALLSVWAHPFARALRAALASATPDPIEIELALDRAWASRAVAGARGAGPEVARLVADALDLTNAVTVLALAGRAPRRAGEQLLEGGTRLDRVTYSALLARDRAAAARALADLFSGTQYAAVFRRAPVPGLEDAVLAARLAAARAAARRAPLSPAPALWYALELRAETTAVSRAVWRLALGAPAAA